MTTSKNGVQHKTTPPKATPTKPTPTADRLPSLTNMHAVAMVTVDTETERLRMQKFGSKAGRAGSKKNKELLKPSPVEKMDGSPNTIQRSKSLMIIKLVVILHAV